MTLVVQCLTVGCNGLATHYKLVPGVGLNTSVSLTSCSQVTVNSVSQTLQITGCKPKPECMNCNWKHHPQYKQHQDLFEFLVNTNLRNYY